MARIRIEQKVPVEPCGWGAAIYVDGVIEKSVKSAYVDLHGWEEMMRPIDGFRQWVEFEGEVQIEDYPDGMGKQMYLSNAEFVSYGGEKCQN
jgi:hypothetical protein